MSAPREAGLAHAAVLAAMHGAVFPHDPWDEAAFRALLGQPGALALIHEAGGFLLLRSVLDEAEILTLGAVEKRRGIAGALLEEALRRLRRIGVRTLYLEVAADNVPARALYEKYGFTAAGLRKAYYQDGGDALNMRLDLAAALAHRP
ncbi:GNAT family N-acetyltransferase [Acidocella sp.]|uniref:GNAT family N-acetyltransferase n=1 Tax=Acidocella sp. TaxID=50710 RepID=UPI003D070ECF